MYMYKWESYFLTGCGPGGMGSIVVIARDVVEAREKAMKHLHKWIYYHESLSIEERVEHHRREAASLASDLEKEPDICEVVFAWAGA